MRKSGFGFYNIRTVTTLFALITYAAFVTLTYKCILHRFPPIMYNIHLYLLQYTQSIFSLTTGDANLISLYPYNVYDSTDGVLYTVRQDKSRVQNYTVIITDITYTRSVCIMPLFFCLCADMTDGSSPVRVGIVGYGHLGESFVKHAKIETIADTHTSKSDPFIIV